LGDHVSLLNLLAHPQTKWMYKSSWNLYVYHASQTMN